MKMNIIINDAKLIDSCIHFLTINPKGLDNAQIVCSELIYCKSNYPKSINISAAMNEGIIHEYNFSGDEMEKIWEIRSRWRNEISITLASSIYLCMIYQPSTLVDDHSIVRTICNTYNISVNDFEWMYEHITI